PGDKTDWSTVRAELDTLPFLSPRRVVVVEAADPFVTRHRAQLEKYVGQPAANGVLILDVKAWPATTKLAKLVPDAQTIVCKAPATLARLFEQGEEPIAVLGAFSWQLRRLAQVARLSRQGLSVAAAMDRAGVPPFAQRGVEQQLRHLGRRRLDRLYEWLLETDF